MIRFTLNGAPVEVQDGESRTLLEFLRNVRCMKGTKEACGTGHLSLIHISEPTRPY